MAVLDAVRRCCVAGCLVVVVAACAANEPGSAKFSPEELLVEGLDAIRTNAYFADRVDWEDVERRSSLLSRDATLQQVHQILRDVLADLDDRHSRLMLDGPMGSERSHERPTGHVRQGVGYIHVPAVASQNTDALAAYRDPGRELLSESACGWIVDVRLNGGGNLHPMLAAVAPLLGPGPAVTYVQRDGTELTISIDGSGGVEGPDGEASVDGSGPLEEGTSVVPVAVLQHLSTASSGEGVVLAFRSRPGTRTFGTETRGVPTAIEGFDLADGSVLALAVAAGTDAGGNLYEEAIDSDERVGYPAARREDLIGDPVYEAARTWLSDAHDCH